MKLNVPQHLKNRMIFSSLILFSAIIFLQYFGYDSVFITMLVAGIVGGLAVILFPDPNTRDS